MFTWGHCNFVSDWLGAYAKWSLLLFTIIVLFLHDMMTSPNGNIFPVTGPLCGEFTGHQWIPLRKASDVSFDLSLNTGFSKQLRCRWFETLSFSLWRHCKNWSSTMNIYSALWILMAWCFSTRASVPTVLNTYHAFPVVYGLNLWCHMINKPQWVDISLS